jgi:hypothetical protein
MKQVVPTITASIEKGMRGLGQLRVANFEHTVVHLAPVTIEETAKRTFADLM